MRPLLPLLLLPLALSACVKPFAVDHWTRDRGLIGDVATRTSWRIRLPDGAVADFGRMPEMDRCVAGGLADDEWCHTTLERGCLDLYRRPDDAVLLMWPGRCQGSDRPHPRDARGSDVRVDRMPMPRRP